MAKQQPPDPQRMETLYKRAESDPQFFHDLVWNTEKVLPSLDYLTRKEKASLLATEPEELLQRISSRLSPRISAENGLDCGASCVGTCTMTCDVTCPATRTLGQVMPEEEVRYSPESVAMFQQFFNKFQR